MPSSSFVQIVFSAILVFPMWFWINFSPIGQAPPAPKKASDLQDENKSSFKPEINVDGSFVRLKALLPLNRRVAFSETKRLKEHVGDVDVREGTTFVQRVRWCCNTRVLKRTPTTTSNPTGSDEKPMSHWEEIGVLWSAPITKFYTNFVAYLAYLSFFTLAVMWPSCGNLLLDCFVWFWTASIAFENTRVAYEKYCVRSSRRTTFTIGIFFSLIV